MIAFYLWDTASDAVTWAGGFLDSAGTFVGQMPRTMRQWKDCIEAADRPGFDAAWLQFAADRAPFRVEYSVRLPTGGETRRVGNDAAFIGPTTVVGCVARVSVKPFPEAIFRQMGEADLTEVVTARDDLARFFELSPDLFCIADFRGYFLRVNRNFQRILGYSEEELLARPFLDFVHPDDRAATIGQMDVIREGRNVIQFRNRYRDSAGSYRWFEWTASPAPDAEVTFAVARDVTERIAMETRLHAREQREKALLDNVATPIHVRDRGGRFEFCNRGFLDAFGLSAASVTGRAPREICPPAVADFLECGDQDVIQSGQVVTREDVVPGPHGPRNFVTSGIPLFDRDGQVGGVASVSTDITEQIRAREADRQMEMARTVQQKLYPARSPLIPGFQVAGAARPVTQLCGDYFDYVPRYDGRSCIIVGDVSGHGLGPALQMVELRALLRTLLRRSEDLAEILEEVNRDLCQDLPESMFISLFLVELDPLGRRFRFVSAGHPAWLLSARREPRMLHSTGPVLGLLPDADYGPDFDWISLHSGDILLLSTDGVVEATTAEQELYGKRRLQAAIAQYRNLDAAGILDALFTDVDGFVNGNPVKDDMTVVVIKAL